VPFGIIQATRHAFSTHEGIHLDKQNQQNRQLILHLIKTKGKGQSIKDIKDLNKQKLKALKTYIEMMQQLEIFCGLILIFLGKFSLFHQAITSIIHKSRSQSNLSKFKRKKTQNSAASSCMQSKPVSNCGKKTA
jgi:hypothetical protein